MLRVNHLSGFGSKKPSGFETDYVWGNVILLLGFEGTDGSQVITNESSISVGTPTVSGDAQIDTAQKKFGSSSCLFDGNADRISYSNSNFFFSNQDFCVESWIRFSNVTGTQVIAGAWTESTNNRVWVFDFTSTALRFRQSSDGGNGNITTFSAAWSPSINTWYHVAVTRKSGTVRMYIDGVMVASGSSPSMFAGSSFMRIGAIQTSFATNFFKGWMDELRISKGSAIYYSDSGYTVPTAAFPRS